MGGVGQKKKDKEKKIELCYTSRENNMRKNRKGGWINSSESEWDG
jgi:hypothetical protein